MNVGIGIEAALFPEKEYIMDISFAVHTPCFSLDSASELEPEVLPMAPLLLIY
jgi:hypothetical protein